MPIRFKHLSIDRKLSLVILLTCTAVLLLAGAAMIATEVFTARRAMMQDMIVLADVVGRNSTAALSFHREEDAEELDKMLSALAADKHIQRAAIYDANGVVFSKYATLSDVLPDRAPADGEEFQPHFAEVTLPIVMSDKRIGTITMRTDLQRIYHQIYLHGVIIGLTFIAIIVMTLALSPRLRRPIAEPILALADVARRVASDKNYAARAVKQGDDEVGLLTDSFNQMMGEIETTQSSLQRANESMQREIAERKLVEEQLRKTSSDLAQAKDVAEAASRAKDQFLAVLSHELRTPLTPVLLIVSLLRNQTGLPDAVREDIETIGRHVELEARLIDDLLDLTRIARGKLQLSFETVDVHLLIRDAMKICCSERMDDLTLSFAASKHLVRADSGRLLQVFWNLLNNATKYTPAGKPISVRTNNVEPDRIRIEVEDKGIGIEPAALEHIFDAFHQVASAGGQRAAGLGLGLTIARALVVAHNGSISAKSGGVGKGSIFTIELQTLSAARNVSPAPTHAPAPPTVAAATAPLRLLLVEDHVGTQKIITRLLTEFGHHVECAASIEAALLVARQNKLDLVISDVGLPDGSGLDLMRKLRDQYGLKGIGLSGFGLDADIGRGREAGFAQYLVKPVDIDELERAIRSVIAG